MSAFIEPFVVEGTAAGTLASRVLIPHGAGAHVPVVYLLHGRGGMASDWDPFMIELHERMVSGGLAALMAVAIDGPWSDRAHWWVDSEFTGDGDVAAGLPVESALVEQFIPAIDAAFPTIAGRGGRIVAGVSMGGAGAVRFALGHPDVFSRAIGLSPAVYAPEPPAGSMTRQHGAFGRGSSLFEASRYRELGYPSVLPAFDPGTPILVQLAAGDHEELGIGAEPEHDLAVEAARLHSALRRTPGVASELRILDGGHDWSLWTPALLEALETQTALASADQSTLISRRKNSIPRR